VLTILAGERRESNRQPTVNAGPDQTVGYQFVGSGDFAITATGSDP